MELALPPSDGLHWLGRVKERYLTDPACQLVLEHSGAVLEADVLRLISLVESQIRSNDEPVSVKKRLVNVIVEALDNLNRHGLEPLDEATFALLVRDGQGYRLTTGNAVPHVVGALLSERVAILNMMGKEDLKEHYLKLLAGRARTARGGAGLGLLKLARKSRAPLGMACHRLGPFTTFFTLEVRVGGPDDPSPQAA